MWFPGAGSAPQAGCWRTSCTEHCTPQQRQQHCPGGCASSPMARTLREQAGCSCQAWHRCCKASAHTCMVPDVMPTASSTGVSRLVLRGIMDGTWWGLGGQVAHVHARRGTTAVRRGCPGASRSCGGACHVGGGVQGVAWRGAGQSWRACTHWELTSWHSRLWSPAAAMVLLNAFGLQSRHRA